MCFNNSLTLNFIEVQSKICLWSLYSRPCVGRNVQRKYLSMTLTTMCDFDSDLRENDRASNVLKWSHLWPFLRFSLMIVGILWMLSTSLHNRAAILSKESSQYDFFGSHIKKLSASSSNWPQHLNKTSECSVQSLFWDQWVSKLAWLHGEEWELYNFLTVKCLVWTEVSDQRTLLLIAIVRECIIAVIQNGQ